MTTIAFDGQTLSVDGKISDFPPTMRKYKRCRDGAVIAITGMVSYGLELMAWYAAGADPEQWPTTQRVDDCPVELVVFKKGRCYWYLNTPHLIRAQGRMAWGSGRSYALGALEAGADSRTAVRIAAKYDPHTGGRIVTFGG